MRNKLLCGGMRKIKHNFIQLQMAKKILWMCIAIQWRVTQQKWDFFGGVKGLANQMKKNFVVMTEFAGIIRNILRTGVDMLLYRAEMVLAYVTTLLIPSMHGHVNFLNKSIGAKFFTLSLNSTLILSHTDMHALFYGRTFDF